MHEAKALSNGTCNNGFGDAPAAPTASAGSAAPSTPAAPAARDDEAVSEALMSEADGCGDGGTDAVVMTGDMPSRPGGERAGVPKPCTWCAVLVKIVVNFNLVRA